MNLRRPAIASEQDPDGILDGPAANLTDPGLKAKMPQGEDQAGFDQIASEKTRLILEE